MPVQQEVKVNNRVRDLLIVMITVFLSVALLYLILGLMGVTDISCMDIGADATATIYDADGKLKQSDVNPDEWVLRNDERLEISLPLPAQAVYEGANDLVFWVYNATVDISFEGRTLLKAGYDSYEKGQLIGNMMPFIEIPDDAYGKTLQITVVSHDHNSNSFKTDYRIMRASDVHFYPMIDKTFFIILFFLIDGASLIAIAWMLINILLEKQREFIRQQVSGILLMLFCLLISVWYLGYKRAFYVVPFDKNVSAMAEYVGMYLCMIPLLMFFYRETDAKPFRQFCGVMSIIFIVECTVSFAITLSPAQWDLSDIVVIYWILLGCTIIGMFVRSFRIWRAPMTLEKILVIGIAVATLIVAMQIVANRILALPNVSGWLETLLHLDFGAVGIVLFITILVSTYLMKVQDDMELRFHQKELEKLAFLDMLTGIPNRTYLEEKEAQLKKQGEEYTVVFMDVDHLKYANDVYGHEMGDQLLKMAATAIRQANERAGGDGFVGRWGGDEFIAFFHDQDEANKFKGCLMEEFDRINQTGRFPFTASISAGSGTGLVDDSLIREADQQMYERKRLHHETEKAATR